MAKTRVGHGRTGRRDRRLIGRDRVAVVLAVLVSVGLTACGSGGEGEAGTTTSSTSPTSTTVVSSSTTEQPPSTTTAPPSTTTTPPTTTSTAPTTTEPPAPVEQRDDAGRPLDDHTFCIDATRLAAEASVPEAGRIWGEGAPDKVWVAVDFSPAFSQGGGAGELPDPRPDRLFLAVYYDLGTGLHGDDDFTLHQFSWDTGMPYEFHGELAIFDPADYRASVTTDGSGALVVDCSDPM